MKHKFCIHGVNLTVGCVQCDADYSRDREERSRKAGTLYGPAAEQWPEVQATIPTVEVAGEASITKPEQPLDIHKPMRVKSSKQPVRVVCVDSVTSKIIMAISRSEGGEYLAFASEIHKHVENVPEKRKGWINLYVSAHMHHVAAASHVYASRGHADDQMNKFGQRIACIEIEWTD